jgi:uncharacterized lipoprotein YmbA
MKTWTLSIGGLFCAALLLSGCATGGASAPKNTTKYDLENSANFVLLDKATQRLPTYGTGKTAESRFRSIVNSRTNRDL